MEKLNIDELWEEIKRIEYELELYKENDQLFNHSLDEKR